MTDCTPFVFSRLCEHTEVREESLHQSRVPIQELLDNEINHVLLILCYDSKVYKGEPIVDINYDGNSPTELFRIQGAITPTVLNLRSERDYLMVKLEVEGTHTPEDIDLETVRITKLGDVDITPVYGELVEPLPTQNRNFLIMFLIHFNKS